MTSRRVIVVGGGAAGLMAAGQAAELGAETLLLEKMNRSIAEMTDCIAAFHQATYVAARSGPVSVDW